MSVIDKFLDVMRLNSDEDYDEFYNFCEKLAENNIVLISEYNMPTDRFECIWSKDVKCLQKSDRKVGEDRTEKLFICKGK